MDQPIACTLAPEEFRDRTGELAAFAAQALLTREPTVDGERLTFVGSPETEARLRDLIAAEVSCCAFLRMELRRSELGLVLDIAGPADARPIIAELFA